MLIFLIAFNNWVKQWVDLCECIRFSLFAELQFPDDNKAAMLKKKDEVSLSNHLCWLKRFRFNNTENVNLFIHLFL